MSNISNTSPIVTEDKLKDFYEDIKPYLGCPAYVTQEGDAEYYSTDEKVIGRWINGKPLYQKVIEFGAGPTARTEKRVNHGIDNLDKVINIFGMDSDSTYQSPLPNCYVNGNTSYLSGLDVTSTSIGIGSDWNISGRTCFIVIQYTKTTDSASTTVEQKPTHYSTDEQVVGTWIDGKPLYQKTVIAPFASSITEGTETNNETSLGISNIDIVFISEAFLKIPSWNVILNLNDTWAASQSPFSVVRCIVKNVSGALSIITSSDRNVTQGLNAYATIKYTKTTD